MISINKDSISHINASIPSLPKGLNKLRGAELPNHDLIVCGGNTRYGYSNDYLHYNHDSNQWMNVGTMNRATSSHSSVWIDGVLLTTGGKYSSGKITSHHEEFSFTGGVKKRKEMPVALAGHTATLYGQQTMIICGGWDGYVSKILYQ